MTTPREIERDPYALEYRTKIFERLRPVVRALCKALSPDRRWQLWEAMEPSLRKLTDNDSAEYFDVLTFLRRAPHCIETDCGERPQKFIAAQLKYPVLRAAYENRRQSEAVYEALRSACSESGE